MTRRLLALDMRVTGVRRCPEPRRVPRRPAWGEDEETPACRVVGPGAWRRLLPETDALLLALPLTDETFRVVGATELALLPPHAYVVNVGRGGTLDDTALLEVIGFLEGPQAKQRVQQLQAALKALQEKKLDKRDKEELESTLQFLERDRVAAAGV